MNILKIKALLLSFALFWFSNAKAQTVQFHLLDCESETHIPYCTALNDSKNIFSVSDDHGAISLSADVGDSIYISHVAYIDTFFILSAINNTICLQPKIIELDEVTITDTEKETYGVGNLREKSGALYAISYDTEYAIEYKFDISNKFLHEIRIPVRYRFDLDTSGLLLFTFHFSDNGNIGEMFGNPYYIKIDQDQKFLNYKLEQPIQIPFHEFFVVFRRIKPNEEHFVFPDRTISVAPFFNIIEPENQVAYRRRVGDSTWQVLDPETQVVPVIKLQFLVSE